MSKEKVTDLEYLKNTMGGRKHLIKEIIDVFLKQVPQDMSALGEYISQANRKGIKSVVHTMKSSASIMGITSAHVVLKEMEERATTADSINEIKRLHIQLSTIFKQAIEELTASKQDYL